MQVLRASAGRPPRQAFRQAARCKRRPSKAWNRIAIFRILLEISHPFLRHYDYAEGDSASQTKDDSV